VLEQYRMPDLVALTPAVAQPLHVGRTSIVVQTGLSDADGKRVALVIQTQAILN
jgi:1,4-dihydroxy-2-naphthoyl-CoA hydrolase